MSISDFSAELRALFTEILDVETGDGACALSLLDALEQSVSHDDYLEPQPIEVNVESNDLEEHSAIMFDLALEMIQLLNERITTLEKQNDAKAN